MNLYKRGSTESFIAQKKKSYKDIPKAIEDLWFYEFFLMADDRYREIRCEIIRRHNSDEGGYPEGFCGKKENSWGPDHSILTTTRRPKPDNVEIDLYNDRIVSLYDALGVEK